MKYNLQKVDELYLPVHKYLTSDDECYFFMNYTPPASTYRTIENSHILNFKKKMDRAGKKDWHYKGETIKEISELFIKNVPPIIEKSSIMIPVPPSIVKGEPMYDDRLVQLVKNYCQAHPETEFREIIEVRETMNPTHVEEKSPEELASCMIVNKALCKNNKDQLVVVDDVLRHGTHYKAIKGLLRPFFTKSNIIGLYIARSIH